MSAETIADLNDRFRSTFIGGRVLMTRGIGALPEGARAEIAEAVRAFAAFTPANDPHGEHDFAAFEAAGRPWLVPPR